MLLLDAFHLLLVLCHQQLRPIEELLLGREDMPFLLALLERLDLRTKPALRRLLDFQA